MGGRERRDVFQRHSWFETSQAIHYRRRRNACDDYLLIARELRGDGSTREREIALFDLS
jgi:hypothetical protein